jgi:DUF3011 family protein
MRIIPLALALLITAAVEAQQLNNVGGTLIRCESINNARTTCKADARARMISLNQQLSDNPCILGKTWGTTRNRKGVWVDDGCRAEFVIGGSAVSRQALGRSVVCESVNNGKRDCPADTSYGVQLARQISKKGCTRGDDWGFDQNGVWVDNGCRAEFALGGDVRFTPMTSASPTRVVCESQNNALNRCTANTFYGVTLARQISDRMCIRGESWGYDSNGIWVTRGCRAEFVLGQ